MKTIFRIVIIFIICSLLAACAPQATAAPTLAPTASPIPTETLQPTITPTPEPSPTPEPTAIVYATTEYEGIFSEKYYPDQFTDSFVFTDKESGIEVPISFGLTSDLPVTALHLTDLGKDLLGKNWLLSNYYRYTEIMGNKMSMDEFLAKMKNGEVRIDVDYFDEITGETKVGTIDPLKGVSITLTGNNKMPLEGVRGTYNSHYYLTKNASGQMIIVHEFDLDVLRDYRQGQIISQGKNPGYVYSFYFYNRLRSAPQYWAMLTKDHFAEGGVEDLNSMKAKMFNDMVQKEYLPLIEKLNPKTATNTPFASAEYTNR